MQQTFGMMGHVKKLGALGADKTAAYRVASIRPDNGWLTCSSKFDHQTAGSLTNPTVGERPFDLMLPLVHALMIE